MAYTYKLIWSIDGEEYYYYGVRYSKSAHPSDLWKTYFTSSRVVKEFREAYGEPKCFVDRVFDDPKEAVQYENAVLVENSAATSRFWLNKSNGHGDYYVSSQTAAKSGETQRGKVLSESHKRKLSIASRKVWSDPEMKRLQSERLKGRKDTDEVRANKKAAQNRPENIEKNRLANLGKKRTLEQKKRYSEAAKRRSEDSEFLKKLGNAVSEAKKKSPIRVCPHCFKEGKGGGMTIYHFDNCRKKPNGHQSLL